jgi:hypothetical protein
MVGFALMTELKKVPLACETEPTPAWAMFTISCKDQTRSDQRLKGPQTFGRFQYVLWKYD